MRGDDKGAVTGSLAVLALCMIGIILFVAIAHSEPDDCMRSPEQVDCGYQP